VAIETFQNLIIGCGVAGMIAVKTDWIYCQYYPVLRAAAPHSK
jgi:hypothetical protein